MARYTGPVVRLSRRLGIQLFANGQSKQKAFTKKNYKPGEHGNKRFSKMSEYGKRLLEKQKARIKYGISEKQSRKYYALANKTEGITGLEYMKLLERRLDNAIFRAGLANTRQQARQFVSHGIIKLNGKRVKVPSITVKEGDKFEVRQKNQGSATFEEIKNSKTKPARWLKVDLKGLKGEVDFLPEKDDIESDIDHQLITEFYSR